LAALDLGSGVEHAVVCLIM